MYLSLNLGITFHSCENTKSLDNVDMYHRTKILPNDSIPQNMSTSQLNLLTGNFCKTQIKQRVGGNPLSRYIVGPICPIQSSRSWRR